MCSNFISQTGKVKHNTTIHSRYLTIVWWLWSGPIQVTFQGCLIISQTLSRCWMTPLIFAIYLLVTLCSSTTFTQLDVTIVCNKVTPGLSAHTDCGRHWLVTAETWPSHEAAQWQTPGSDKHVCSLRDKPSMGHVSRENRDVLEKKKSKESLVPKSPHVFSVHIFL